MTTKQRLLKVQKSTAMTTSDISRWFNVPYHTARCWLVNGAEPDKDVEPALTKLEKVANLQGGMLRELPQRQRSSKLRSLCRS